MVEECENVNGDELQLEKESDSKSKEFNDEDSQKEIIKENKEVDENSQKKIGKENKEVDDANSRREIEQRDLEKLKSEIRRHPLFLSDQVDVQQKEMEKQFLELRRNQKKRDKVSIKFDSHCELPKKGEEKNYLLNSFVPKDAAEDWHAGKKTHIFYFVKHRSYDDPKIRPKRDLGDKELYKLNKAHAGDFDDVNSVFHWKFIKLGSSKTSQEELTLLEVKKFGRFDIAPTSITWRRVMDVNDWSLKKITTGQRHGDKEMTSEIYVASEFIAVLIFTTSTGNMREKPGKMVMGKSKAGNVITIVDFSVSATSTILMNAATNPILLETLKVMIGNMEWEYDYRQSYIPAYGYAAPFSQLCHHQIYELMYALVNSLEGGLLMSFEVLHFDQVSFARNKAETDRVSLLPSELVKNDKVISLVGILHDEVGPMAYVMKVENDHLESYANTEGFKTQIQKINEAVELPLIHCELYEDIDIKLPKGVILYGELGTRKTLRAKMVANSTSATFLRIVGSELIHEYLGDGHKLVNELFIDKLSRSGKTSLKSSYICLLLVFDPGGGTSHKFLQFSITTKLLQEYLFTWKESELMLETNMVFTKILFQWKHKPPDQATWKFYKDLKARYLTVHP